MTDVALGRTTGLTYAFDHRHERPARELSDLLGGKGAGLAEMTASLGISVPPGFTITVPVCRAYQSGGWPSGLDAEIDRQLRRLEAVLGRGFGDSRDPLLVAVRSGAPVSMPGMLDTVLNLGLNDETVLGLAEVSGDERFAWDSYRRFLTMFAATVLGVEVDEPDGADPRAAVEELQRRIEDAAGRPVPEDPGEQLRCAVEAVFDSWTCDRARAYRSREQIPDDLGTAVNVQAMVFGNRGVRSGTGVVFTRNPSTGAAELFGDYLPDAQGEDVVGGSAKTLPIDALADRLPEVHAELASVLRRLETHYRDVCDVEFTVEDGRLWLLQTRVGKRGPVAAVRTAVAFVEDPDVRLTRAEALARAPRTTREAARREITGTGTGNDDPPLARGLGASGGRVSGAVVLDSASATEADEDVILVRKETRPEDVIGMSASVGVLTTRGGLVSHAAVVARGWGLPAVVGADAISWHPDRLVIGDQVVAAGDTITIDGTSGAVWRGTVAARQQGDVDQELPELAVLDRWEAEQLSPRPTAPG